MLFPVLRTAIGLTAFTAACAVGAPSALRFSFSAAGDAPGRIRVPMGAEFEEAAGFGFDRPASLQPGATAFAVAVPDGNYRVTVTLAPTGAQAALTVKAQARRLMIEAVKTPAGGESRRTFLVNVRQPTLLAGGRVRLDPREWDAKAGRALTPTWDGRLVLTFTGGVRSLAAVDVEPAPTAPTLFIAGDSTATDQSRGPGASWGQMLPRWFGATAAVANHAESGETLGGFLREGRWQKVLESVRPGDWVLIQFGTNDSKAHGPQNIYPGQDFSETYAPAAGLYRQLLSRFIREARVRGALPIILSPSARMGETPGRRSSLADYAEAAMETARTEGVPGIDLNAMGVRLNAALGADAARQFADRTHHVEYGAYLIAECVVEGIRRSGCPLSALIDPAFGGFDPDHPHPTPGEFDLPPDNPVAR